MSITSPGGCHTITRTVVLFSGIFLSTRIDNRFNLWRGGCPLFRLLVFLVFLTPFPEPVPFFLDLLTALFSDLFLHRFPGIVSINFLITLSSISSPNSISQVHPLFYITKNSEKKNDDPLEDYPLIAISGSCYSK